MRTKLKVGKSYLNRWGAVVRIMGENVLDGIFIDQFGFRYREDGTFARQPSSWAGLWREFRPGDAKLERRNAELAARFG